MSAPFSQRSYGDGDPRPLLLDACTSGDEDELTRLLSNSASDYRLPLVAADALRAAASAHHWGVVERLLSEPRIAGPSFMKGGCYCKGHFDCIRIPAAGGCLEGVARIMAHPNVDAGKAGAEALAAAAGADQMDIVSHILADARVVTFLTPASSEAAAALEQAARGGHLPLLQRLLEHSCLDHQYLATKALIAAAEAGQLAVVDHLLSCSRADPSHVPHRSKFVLVAAAENGHAAVVERLLADPRIDPAGPYECRAVRCAAERGHLDTLQVLLADPRCASAEVRSKALIAAAQAGCTAVVAHLLSDRLLQPHLASHTALATACTHKRSAVVRFLLADGRIDPNAGAWPNRPIEQAVLRGMLNTVKTLLADPRLIPNPGFVCAATECRWFLMYRLLADARVDAATDDNAALKATAAAATKGSCTAFLTLMSLPEVHGTLGCVSAEQLTPGLVNAGRRGGWLPASPLCALLRKLQVPPRESAAAAATDSHRDADSEVDRYRQALRPVVHVRQLLAAAWSRRRAAVWAWHAARL